MTGIGVVLLDLGQHDMTMRCLRSLAAGTTVPETVVAVENGQHLPAAATGSLAGSLPLVVLGAGYNLGCAGGRNLGLNYLARNTEVTTFVVLDNDAVAAPDLIERLAAAPPSPLEVVAPVIFDAASGSVWSSGGSIDGEGELVQLDDDLIDHPEAYREVDWAPGACLVMHKDTWLAVGEFDSWMVFLYEDIEWCHRLRAAGGRVLVARDLRIDHVANQSLGGRYSPARLRLGVRNETVLRISVIGRSGTVAFLGRESLSALRDLAGRRLGLSAARARGLAEGLAEAHRRGFARPAGRGT